MQYYLNFYKTGATSRQQAPGSQEKRSKFINGFAALLLLPLLAIDAESQASPTLKICASYSTGAMTAKKKCKTNERTINWFELQSTLSNVCTIRSTVGYSSNDSITGNAAAATTICNPGETMTTWGYQTVPASPVVLREASIQSNNGIPTGIFIISQCEYYGCFGAYSLVVSAVCCAE
jgi:hypothetical protein